ncbi:MAG: PD-(D/E)XK nuclease domain-containing protein, partial [Lachnospiraceae bacterium]|nr:PD-(D/E)XK nuclease domain-containing protein [Lachnospiraceae bacterium]
SNSIVRDLIERADSATKAEIERLIEGGSIEKPVHEDITYGEIYEKQDNLWNFMFFTGYLKIISQRFENDILYATMVIPNRETRYIYSQKIINWFDKEIVKKADRSAMFDAMKKGDAESFEREINKLLTPSISYMDSYENFYHGFMTGILSGSNEYTVKSNRESGSGRSDILVRPVRIFEKAFVIELKTVKQEGKRPVTMEMMDAAAEEAIKQIDDLSYADALLEDGYGNIGRYGISFFRKDCRVHYRDGY